MDLVLNNINVAAGSTLEGTATLTLNKDIKAKGVVATLYAGKWAKNQGPFTQSYFSRRQNYVYVQVYSEVKTLDKEKLYTKQNSPYKYNFSFIIPEIGAATPETSNSILGMLKDHLKAGNQMRWFVVVELSQEKLLVLQIEKTQEIKIIA